MKTILLIFLGITSFAIAQQSIDFPLEIGTKWYFRTVSTQNNQYYGLSKEIIDTTENGFRKIITTYFWRDSLVLKNEYMAYIDGILYTNTTPQISNSVLLYISPLTQDSCFYLGSFNECWYLIEYQIFGLSRIAHKNAQNYIGHGYGSSQQTITFPEVGVVHMRKAGGIYPTTEIDSSFLTGMFRNGVIYGDTILTYVGSSAPNFLFILEQNYPNPFNPTTKIKYQIPEAGFISLIVYDILGREVATLVNEEKPTGSYDIEFDGSGLSSGVYFYKLQTGNFSSIKKMILMR